jgi:hypothetical protein
VTVAQWSTVCARAALIALCMIIVVNSPRKIMRILGAVGAVLLAVSIPLVILATTPGY